MKRIVLSLKLLLAFLLFGSGASILANDNAKLFGKMPDILDIALSPDGSRIAFVTPTAKTSVTLYTVPTSGGKPVRVATMDGQPEVFNWCEFVSNKRLICQIYSIAKFESYNVGLTKKIAFDIDGRNGQAVERKDTDHSTGIRTGSGQIIDWLDGQDNSILLSWYFFKEGGRTGTRFRDDKEGLGVLKFDTLTGQYDIVVKPAKGIDAYLSDGEGNVRILGNVAMRGATGNSGSAVQWKYRQKGSKKWLSLSTYDLTTGDGFGPIRIDAKANKVFGLEKIDGKRVLSSIALDGTGKKEVVFAHERFDVSGIATLGHAGRTIGARYVDDAPRIAYSDPALAKLSKSLSRALPGEKAITFLDASVDEKKILLMVSSDVDPGRYYLFDKSAGRLEELMPQRVDVEPAKLGRMKPITFTARDGTSVPGYLTLPAGSDGKNVRAIVMPHGGPGSRDVWGFDWWAQFFASEGYAVLQPNFRGSTGYGEEWFVDNGFKSWEIAISDIEDAGKWMISEGIAGADKLAIVGWSYGGYAALQSAVHDPGLFKAAIAVAPVTDLGLLKEDSKGFANSANTREFIGSGAHITQGSPLRNVGKIQIPVLMFHGDRDMNVLVRHAKRMHKALLGANKSSEIHIYPELEHGLRSTDARTDMLTRSAAFLDKYLAK
ncbi:MAG: alpha/beta fold hydrolase [Sphingorhabdus sp.]